ncbi:MAG: hypothetical protein PUF12_11235, partial [Thermoflexaceae bacterium]|nr:hypothetical protein [Thermoflexaceae bacterium]
MLICNGKILTMAGKTFQNGYVRTKGKIITGTGDMKDLKKPYNSEIILDVNGSIVMPGIIDAHSHIG